MYKSCQHALHGLCFYSYAVVLCCYSPNEQINGSEAPVLFRDYQGEIIPKTELFKKMREYSDIFKNGGTPNSCKGCFKIQEADWDEDEYIDFVTVTHYTCCNADCVYCSNNLEPSERTNDKYEILPFLKYLKQEGVLKENFELHLGGGEFTIYKECEGILQEFGATGFAKIFVATNGIKFSQGLYDSIKYGGANIVISLDCGSKNTFKKIKRVDAFDKVVENIKKYAQADPIKVTMKYIIIPGMNDSMSEYCKFLKICEEAGINNIRIDIDCRYLRKYNNELNPFYYSLIEKMKEKTVKKGFYYEDYSFLLQAMNTGIKKKSLNSLIEYIKLKYLKSLVEELYTERKYNT